MMGSAVKGIEAYAFSNCASLGRMYFLGHPPVVDSAIFFQTSDVIVYYLPGTTGWAATFGGRPTALWLPQMQSHDGDFGLNDNLFGFNFSWAGDRIVMVDAATSLSTPDWTPFSTNTLTDGSSLFSDSESSSHATRFYRLRSP